MREMKDIAFDGVCRFSAEDPERSDLEMLEGFLSRLDHRCVENQFAANFKRLFLRVRDYYREEMENEN